MKPLLHPEQWDTVMFHCTSHLETVTDSFSAACIMILGFVLMLWLWCQVIEAWILILLMSCAILGKLPNVVPQFPHLQMRGLKIVPTSLGLLWLNESIYVKALNWHFLGISTILTRASVAFYQLYVVSTSPCLRREHSGWDDEEFIWNTVIKENWKPNLEVCDITAHTLCH